MLLCIARVVRVAWEDFVAHPPVAIRTLGDRRLLLRSAFILAQLHGEHQRHRREREPDACTTRRTTRQCLAFRQGKVCVRASVLHNMRCLCQGVSPCRAVNKLGGLRIKMFLSL